MTRAETAIIAEMLSEADMDGVEIEFVKSSKNVPRNTEDTIYLHPFLTYAKMREVIEEKHIRKKGTVHFDTLKSQFDFDDD